MKLVNLKCTACKGDEPILSGSELSDYMECVEGWDLNDEKKKIKKSYSFGDFSEALKFVNQVAIVSEEEGHHPDIFVHDYKKVRIDLWTHKIGGLHKNDFIMASKIDIINIKS